MNQTVTDSPNFTRGRSYTVHAPVYSGDRVIGTQCATDTRLGSRQSLYLRPVFAAVTCKTCLKIQAA
jgi:hypothetical protein